MEFLRDDVLRLAVAPWNSVYRDDPAVRVSQETQNEIDFCLYHCPYANSECCNCLDGKSPTKKGRPNSDIDMDRLKEMLRLKTPSRKICKEFGISEKTVYNYKKKLGVI